jgi:hypothetical protein
MMRKIINYVILFGISGLLLGCAWGNQPVVWKKSGPVDYQKKLIVEMAKMTRIPDDEMGFLKNNIELEVGKLFSNADDGTYSLKVTITRYDDGDAGLRFLLAGLGQMYLYGTVELIDTTAKISVREGEFKKNYSVGGLAGASATMRSDLSSKVGKAIADALKQENKNK